MSASSTDSIFTDRDERELAEYRPVCVTAVLGLILGLAAPLALLHPVLWGLPVAGAAVSFYALRVIERSEPMTGRRAARIGLALGLLLGVWAPAKAYCYEWLVVRDADRFAQSWFALLRSDEPHKAFQLTVAPAERSALDDALWDEYRKRTSQRQGLESYVQQPLVRTLIALGDRALVRRFAVQSAASDSQYDGVDSVYAVSWDDAGQRRTFFVRLQMARNRSLQEGPVEWRITSSEGGYRPVALGGKRE